jgi:hypothetical protein
MLRIPVLVAALLMLQAPAAPVVYEAFAVRFGTLPSFPVASLVVGAEPGRRLDIPVMVWLLKGSDGRNVLIDSGFYRQKFLDQWKPRDFRSPAAATASCGFDSGRFSFLTGVKETRRVWS